MREESHEKGRRQLFSLPRLLGRLSGVSASISEVDNAYTTAMMSSVPSASGKAAFDAVHRIEYSDGVIEICCVESKMALQRSTIAKLPSQFTELVVKAYDVTVTWTDDWNTHRPLFLFVTSNQFQSLLYVMSAGDEAAIQSLLTKHRPNPPGEAIARVCNQVQILAHTP